MAGIAKALARCEERLIYEREEDPDRDERSDAWYVRKLGEWIAAAAEEEHLRHKGFVVTLEPKLS